MRLGLVIVLGGGHVALADVDSRGPLRVGHAQTHLDVLPGLRSEFVPLLRSNAVELRGDRPGVDRQRGHGQSDGRGGNERGVGRVRAHEDVARGVHLDGPVMRSGRIARHLNGGREVAALPRTERDALADQELRGQDLHLVRAEVAHEVDAVVPRPDDGARADVGVGPVNDRLAACRGGGRPDDGGHDHVEARRGRLDKVVGPHVGIGAAQVRHAGLGIGPRIVVHRVAQHVGGRGDEGVAGIDAGAEVVQAIVPARGVDILGVRRDVAVCAGGIGHPAVVHRARNGRPDVRIGE